MRIDLNYGWEFTTGPGEGFFKGAAAGGASIVDLPHTCAETPYNCFDESVYRMLCGYRKTVALPEARRGKRVILHVGAAAHRAEVFVNGQKLIEHNCGYTEFSCELTDFVAPGGEALIAIRVDSRETLDQPPFGFVIDYMTYGGIYREVWLEVVESTYISDVFVMPNDRGEAECTVTVDGECKEMTLRRSILFEGETVASDELNIGSPDIERERTEFTMPKLAVPDAKLWDTDAPNLYVQRTELIKDGEVIDCRETRFGFRTARFRADGFYLNGKKLKLRGLNRHQSYPYIGYAAPASIQRFDAEFLKNELGCNAVRTSHYPQSQAFIDRCDELGLLVFTEIPGWQHIGGEEWKKQAIKNTAEMVEQYRNHPSIILWGVRINESVDCDELYEKTNATARRLDPTRQTGGVRCYKKGSFLEDVYTYNDFVHEGNNIGCEPKKNVTPDMSRAYLVTEYNGHMFPTKSFDCEERRLEHALRHANVLDAIAGQSDICGSFGWCMADYNTHRDFGSGDRICYHGVADMFRNKKLAAYVYASQQEKTPVLAFSSSMDIGEHPAAVRGRLFAFTNADSVRVYKNGEFIREFTPADSPYKNLKHPPIELDDLVGEAIAKNEGFAPKQAEYVKELINYSAAHGFSNLKLKHKLHAAWLMLRYRMSFGDAYALYGKYTNNWGGEATVWRLEVVKDGKTVKALDVGPMDGARLEATASKTGLTHGAAYDMALVRFAACDRYGNTMPFCSDPVELIAEGPIELVGPSIVPLRGGMGGAFVKTTGAEGNGTLILKPQNAPEVRIEFTVSTD